MIALGGAALYLLTREKAYPLEPVQGSKTGRNWLVRVASVSGSGDAKQTVVEVYAPEASYGPHKQLFVASYRQTGSDKASRVVVQQNPHALPQMVADAGLDFGIHKAA